MVTFTLTSLTCTWYCSPSMEGIGMDNVKHWLNISHTPSTRTFPIIAGHKNPSSIMPTLIAMSPIDSHRFPSIPHRFPIGLASDMTASSLDLNASSKSWNAFAWLWPCSFISLQHQQQHVTQVSVGVFTADLTLFVLVLYWQCLEMFGGCWHDGTVRN